MLDFAIFAVTFLLVLVGAVLYLYPVMAAGARHGPGAGSGRPRGPARPGPCHRPGTWRLGRAVPAPCWASAPCGTPRVTSPLEPLLGRLHCSED